MLGGFHEEAARFGCTKDNPHQRRGAKIASSNVDPVEAGGIIQHGALPAIPDPVPNGLHP